jgi:competence protein ComEA
MDAKPSQEPSVEPVSPVTPIVAPKPAARSVGPGGGQIPAPAARSGLGAIYATLKENPWFAVGSRALGIVAGMLALAGIGAASTLAGHGVTVELPKASAAPTSSSGVWIAPDPPAASVAPPARGSSEPVRARGEGAAAAPSASAPGAPSSSGLTADGKVILNLASADELTKLPKVGAKRAQAILELRRKLGRFRQPTDLLRVRGIGRKTLKLMLPLLVVDPPNG